MNARIQRDVVVRLLAGAVPLAVMLGATGPAVAVAQQGDYRGMVVTNGPSDIWNQHWSKGTRTNIDPSELMKQSQPTNIKTETNGATCVGAGALGTGLKACYDDKGTISLTANVVGGQATIYGNPDNGNMGGCLGVGGPLVNVGGVDVSASAEVCGDKEKGLVGKTSVGAGFVKVGTTYYDGNR